MARDRAENRSPDRTAGDPSERGPRSTAETARLVVAGVLLVLLVLFIVANTDKTEIDFLVGSVDVPLILVLLVTAAVGAIISELARFRRKRHRS